MNPRKTLFYYTHFTSKVCSQFLRTITTAHLNHHPYKNIKFISSELANNLVQNITYNENGIIVFNKPHGISLTDGQPKEGNLEVSFHTLLPFLKNKLNCQKIFPVKIPEKYASGVAIFCNEEKMREKLRNCLKSMRAQQMPSDQYDCIVVGQPNSETGQFNGGVTVEVSPNKKQKRIKLVQECSKSQVRHGIIKNTLIEHETVSANNLASRIRINISRNKWHSLRIYAATHLASPLLGDRIFGGLVKTVLGKPVLVDIWSPAASLPPKLPKELLSKLDLASREDIGIPLHFHLLKVTLNNFPIKNQALEFYADPPEYYLWTCSRLNLILEGEISDSETKELSS